MNAFDGKLVEEDWTYGPPSILIISWNYVRFFHFWPEIINLLENLL